MNEICNFLGVFVVEVRKGRFVRKTRLEKVKVLPDPTTTDRLFVVSLICTERVLVCPDYVKRVSVLTGHKHDDLK